jgi:methionyl-tRNA formyltransferase
MTNMSKTIVFFGSGPVAAASLELLAKHTPIEAVITKPQPAHHKQIFPVLATAEKLGLKVLTPDGKKELSELFATKPAVSKLGIVIDYGFIINQDVIDYFPLGILNSHFSLLPEWRGADPISFSILSGQQETGVSLMRIVEKMDEGPILAHETYQIPAGATTPTLTEALIKVSDKQLQQVLQLYYDGVAKVALQEQVALPGHEVVSYSRKLLKADGVLDWTKPALQLEREVRAFIEWPKSHTTIADKEVVVTKAHIIPGKGKIGEIWRDGKSFGVCTTKDIFVIDCLKPAGKQEMPASAFLAGYKI